MSKNRKILLSVVLVILLIVVIIWRYTALNKDYPNPKVITYQEGERIKGGDIEITILSSELVSMEKVLELAPDVQNEIRDTKGELLKNEQKKVLLVKLGIQNLSDAKQSASVAHFAVQSDAWTNGVDLNTYCALNDVQETAITLDARETQEVMAPFYLYEIQFTGHKFQKIGERQFQLVLSTYPVKNMVELQLN